MKRILILLSIVSIVVAVQVPLAWVHAQPSAPGAIVQKLADACNAADVEAGIALFADAAFINTVPSLPSGAPATISGSRDIRKWLEGLVAVHFRINIEILATHGNIVVTNTSTWADPTNALGVAPLVANEIYIIQNGKITGFTWVLSDDSLKKLTAALAAPLPGPVKVSDIVGTWVWRGGGFYLKFYADGTFRGASYLEGLTSNPPQDGNGGQFKIDGKLLTLTAGQDAQ